MERLNRSTAPQAKKYTERVIQFGEGNFLRAFIDWIIWKTNQKTGFDGGVVVVQPIDRGLVPVLNEQDGLYHLNLQGLLNGQPVDSIDMIDVITRGVDPYADFASYMALAEQPEIRFVISNTTEPASPSIPPAAWKTRPRRPIPASSLSCSTTASRPSPATLPRDSSSSRAS